MSKCFPKLHVLDYDGTSLPLECDEYFMICDRWYILQFTIILWSLCLNSYWIFLLLYQKMLYYTIWIMIDQYLICVLPKVMTFHLILNYILEITPHISYSKVLIFNFKTTMVMNPYHNNCYGLLKLRLVVKNLNCYISFPNRYICSISNTFQ